MANITYKALGGEMATHGFLSYEVYADGEFVGMVFPFFPDVDARGVRWLAQTTRGVLHGRTVPFNTRKEAAKLLVERRMS